MDSIASGLLFADGSAATLVSGDDNEGIHMNSFYSEVALHGQEDMAWHLSGRGFLMKLSAYIPQLLQAGIEPLLKNALKASGHLRESITHWAIHPGGKKILESIQKELQLSGDDMQVSYEVLRNYGNMSSPTILFVLKNIFSSIKNPGNKVFAAAFGPGLTMETLILET
jgi:predicted naringenin-chalcone synthase